MKKKITVLLAVVLVITSFAVGVLSKGIIEKIEAELRGDFTVYVDGKKQNFKNVNGEEVEPILYEGTTYLPVRAIGELMGKKVYWYQEDKKIELVTPSLEESLVTDADVIVEGENKVKEKKEKAPEGLNAEITLDEAKKAVLEKAGVKEANVVFTKAKLDYDDGKLYYEIDFKTEENRYDAEVDALTGEIKEWEVEQRERKAEVKEEKAVAEDEVTLEEAKEIALEKAGLKAKDVVFEEAKLDRDDGREVYDIEFRHGRVEYSAEIDALTGNVIEWEKDND